MEPKKSKKIYNMNGLEEDIKTLNQHVDDVKEKVETVLRILQGPKDKEEPSGLIHNVYMNSLFRRVVITWLWLLTGSVLTIAAQVFFSLFTGGN